MCFRQGQDNEELEVWRLWIPSDLTPTLISQARTADDGLHNGGAKTIHKLRQLYFWPKLSAQVTGFIRECEKCKTAKTSHVILRNPMGHEHPLGILTF